MLSISCELVDAEANGWKVRAARRRVAWMKKNGLVRENEFMDEL